jgi:hypothetical protein
MGGDGYGLPRAGSEARLAHSRSSEKRARSGFPRRWPSGVLEVSRQETKGSMKVVFGAGEGLERAQAEASARAVGDGRRSVFSPAGHARASPATVVGRVLARRRLW